MDRELLVEFKSVDLGAEESLTKAALQIKELARDGQGVFELGGLDTDAWEVAAVIYPIYTKYETSINKKSGYPDIMAQMRVLKQRAYVDFEMSQVVGYLEMLIGTIETISPEIYENYRELVEDFRETIHKSLNQFSLDYSKPLAGLADRVLAGKLADILERAFAEKVMLREKYENYAKALKG